MPVGFIFRIWRTAADTFNSFTDWHHRPPLRHQAQFGFFEAIGEQGGGGGVHAFRLVAFGLGAHGVEIDEPGFEQRLGDGFQGGVGFA
ncbi:hypothetical protein D9M68_816270 [compost metagenome]